MSGPNPTQYFTMSASQKRVKAGGNDSDPSLCVFLYTKCSAWSKFEPRGPKEYVANKEKEAVEADPQVVQMLKIATKF